MAFMPVAQKGVDKEPNTKHTEAATYAPHICESKADGEMTGAQKVPRTKTTAREEGARLL